MADWSNPMAAAQKLKMNYGNVNQVIVKSTVRDSGSKIRVTVFIDSERDSRDYVALMNELYESGLDMSDNGLSKSGNRRLVGKK